MTGSHLIALDDYHCYAKLSVGGARLSTFSLKLDLPPPSDPSLADELAAVSAVRYGRDRTTVERDLRELLDRIDFLHQERFGTTKPGEPGVGVSEVSAPPGGAVEPASSSRNQRRPASKSKKRKVAGQVPLFDMAIGDMPHGESIDKATSRPYGRENGASAG